MKFGVLYLPTYVAELDGSAATFYARTLEQIELADELGFENVWLTEHVMVHPYMMPPSDMKERLDLYWSAARGAGHDTSRLALSGTVLAGDARADTHWWDVPLWRAGSGGDAALPGVVCPPRGTSLHPGWVSSILN